MRPDGNDVVVVLELYDRDPDGVSLPVGVGATPLEAFLDARATLARAVREVDDVVADLYTARDRRAGAQT